MITLGLGTSADGLDFYPADGPWGSSYAGNIFQARFDFELNDPTGAGRDVVRIIIEESKPNAPTATSEVFAKGFFQPLDVEVDPFGHVVVMEYGSYDGSVPGRIFRVALLSPADTDADGDVDLHDFGCLQACFTGSDPTSIPSECQLLDLDGDLDIDLIDFRAWRVAFTGP